MSRVVPRAGKALGWRAAQLAGTQIISLIRLLILTSLVAPDAFGLLAVATASIGLLMGLTNIGMVQALVQRPNPTEEEYDIAWTVGLLRAAAVSAILMVLAPVFAGMFDTPQATQIVRLMALRPIIAAAGSIGVARLTRELAFRRLAFIALPPALVDAVVAIAFAAYGVWALVAGTLIGAVAQVIMSYLLAPHRVRFRFDTTAAEPLVRFGQWILFIGVVSLVGSSLTQLVISRTLDAAALGRYFVASKLAFLASETAAAVIGSVAFPLYAAHRDDAHRTAAAFGALLTGQMVVFLPALAILFVLAPELDHTLGAQWAGTAPTMQILTFACAIGLFGDAVSPLLLGQGRADRAFVVEIVQTGVRLLLLVPMVIWLGIPGAALAWLIGNLAGQIVGASFARQILRHALDTLAAKRLTVAVATSLLAAAVAASVSAVLAGLPALVVGSIVAGLAAIAMLWLFDRFLALHLAELLPWHADWARPTAVTPVSPSPVDA